MTGPRRIAILGGGVAAFRAAERLRERDFTGALTIIGAEPHRAYRRPALSDEVLVAHGRAALALHGRLPARTRWLTDTRADGIDLQRRTVHTDRHGDVLFDQLIVATGLAPRTLPLFDQPEFADVVHLPTTLDAVLSLLRAVRRGSRVLVVGAGLVGTEVAESLTRRGARVTLVDAGSQLLATALDADLAAAVADRHRRHGVDVRLGNPPTAVARTGGGLHVTLADGAEVSAAHVVVAIGSVPRTEFAAGTLATGADGVLCDATLHAEGMEDVVACGDCAAWPNLRFGGTRRRVEQWTNASRMGRHAADALLDGRHAARPYAPVTWGWTEQWGVRLQFVGEPRAPAAAAHDEGEPLSLSGSRSWRDPLGRTVGGVAIERPWAMLELARRIDSECPAPDADAARRVAHAAAGVDVPAARAPRWRGRRPERRAQAV